jgi:F-box protein 21
MAPKRLTDLPDEILREICFFLDWNDALSLQPTSRRFRDVANEHLLWKYYCRSSFKYWAASHQLSAKLADPSFVHWKQLFGMRHRADIKTESTLQSIICGQKGRTPKIESIAELGYDSKEVLLQNCATASQSHDHLARRYEYLCLCAESSIDICLGTGLMWCWAAFTGPLRWQNGHL